MAPAEWPQKSNIHRALLLSARLNGVIWRPTGRTATLDDCEGVIDGMRSIGFHQAILEPLKPEGMIESIKLQFESPVQVGRKALLPLAYLEEEILESGKVRTAVHHLRMAKRGTVKVLTDLLPATYTILNTTIGIVMLNTKENVGGYANDKLAIRWTGQNTEKTEEFRIALKALSEQKFTATRGSNKHQFTALKVSQVMAL